MNSPVYPIEREVIKELESLKVSNLAFALWFPKNFLFFYISSLKRQQKEHYFWPLQPIELFHYMSYPPVMHDK